MKEAGKIAAKAKGGTRFDDTNGYRDGALPTKVRVSYGAAVDSVQFEYDGASLEKHGGNGGCCDEGTLGDGKYIRKVRAACGNFGGKNVLTALAFYDQDGRRIAGNERGGDVKELEAGEGECICALYGETVQAGGTGIVSAVGIYTCPLPGVGDLFGMMRDTVGKLKR